MWWHRGRCLSYREGVAFWALAEIMRQRLGIAEDDPAEVAAAKLAEGLERFISDSGERRYVGKRLGRAGRGGRRRGRWIAAGAGRAVRRVAAVFRAAGRFPTGRPADRGRPVRRQRAAGLPGPPGPLGAGPAGVHAGIRPARARPGPAGVRHRAEPGTRPWTHSIPSRWASWFTRWCRERPRTPCEDHRPRPGQPAVRGGDGPVADRPGHRAADRGGLPPGGQGGRAGRAGQPARVAGRPARHARS